MINREFMEKRVNIIEVNIEELGETVFIKKPTVLDIKNIQKLDEFEQGVAIVEMLVVDEKGKKIFTKKDVEGMDVELFYIFNKVIEQSGAIPNMQVK